MKKYDVIIIGGGASGMMAAIQAGKRGRKSLILEHNNRLGKKILATGNGKCNYTNLYQGEECYRGTNPEFAHAVIHKFDCNETIYFFKELGILPKFRNGYAYPNSEQAASIADVLALECARYRVKVKLSEHVVKVAKEEDTFFVSTETYTYESSSVILATGGCAASKQGSDGSGFPIAKSFGHTIVPTFPALVQLKSKEKYGKVISGVRCEAKGTITCNGNEIVCENGEFLFTDYGVSGIPIFQMSRFALDLIEKKQTPMLSIDFFPQMTSEECYTYLKQRFVNGCYKTAEQVMIGMLNHKLSYLLLTESRIPVSNSATEVTDKELRNLVKYLKELKFTITGSNGYEQAQVSAGGISTAEVDENTMESKLVKGLFFTGEVLDVDGTCGGYNLQWAWSSGHLAGEWA